MEKEYRFTAVEFPDDPNVAGRTYWYLCPFEANVGDGVRAPLGRHNNEQRGVIRKIIFADEFDAPYPLYLVKSVKAIKSPASKPFR